MTGVRGAKGAFGLVVSGVVGFEVDAAAEAAVVGVVL